MIANTLLASAIANGYDGLSTRDVMLCVLQGAGLSDYYPNPGPPVGTPASNSLLNIIVDSNGRQWQYYGGAWH